MRKQLAVAFGLAVVATPALATKARLEALGEDNFGSYYINDNRNYFLNVARINDHKDLVTYEFGSSGDDAATTVAPNTPKAEGGFTKGHGNLVYGLQFGGTSPTVGTVRNLAGVPEVQPWELMVGGDAGLKWGASLLYEDFNAGGPGSTNRSRSNSLRVRGGVMMGEMEFFGNVSLKNNAKQANGNRIEGDIGFLAGASTMVQNYRVFLDYTRAGGEYNNTTATSGTNQDFDLGRIRLGAGRAERLNDRATLFAKLMLVRETVEDDGAAALSSLGDNAFTGAGEYTSYILPLNIGLEFAATSWLDLRASVGHNIYSTLEVDPKNGSKYDGRRLANTAVRAGASLKFGEFAVDGLISTDAAGDGIDSTDASTDGGAGTIRTDSLMTRVSMIYRF